MTVSEIIELLGGVKAIADFTGWPYTTIDSWRENGNVPEWRRSKLLEMALANGNALAPTDFPDKPEREAA